MCKVISVVNQKGGVGKTNVSVNLGIGLARAGKKVLLLDADPQGSMTASLGYEEPGDLGILYLSCKRFATATNTSRSSLGIF